MSASKPAGTPSSHAMPYFFMMDDLRRQLLQAMCHRAASDVLSPPRCGAAVDRRECQIVSAKY
jgi:hypothetical protein